MKIKDRETPTITNAEWEVMRVVWTSGKTTSKEIRDILNDEMDWKSATTKTLIGRLAEKGMLHTEKDGRRYIYSPAVSEEESVREAAKDVFEHVCPTKKGTNIKNVIEAIELSQSDIEKLMTVLEEKRQTAPDKIVCDCVKGQCDCHVNEEEN